MFKVKAVGFFFGFFFSNMHSSDPHNQVFRCWVIICCSSSRPTLNGKQGGITEASALDCFVTITVQTKLSGKEEMQRARLDLTAPSSSSVFSWQIFMIYRTWVSLTSCLTHVNMPMCFSSYGAQEKYSSWQVEGLWLFKLQNSHPKIFALQQL